MKYMCILPWVCPIHLTKKKIKKDNFAVDLYVHLPTLLHKHESKSMLGNYVLITKG